ncbi:MAG: DUF3256 family protein [Bacteroidaceae bacterium]|nr:DUF3256 family protein [Bacteroidaceae bacterium]
MIKRILAILFLCLPAHGAVHAGDLRSLFINMPDSIMPTLTRSERMDFLDYMDSGMKARVRNRLGGESVMTGFSDRSLTVITSQSGRLEMVLFPLRKGKNLICIIKTVTARFEDSRLSFYNEDWTPVDGRKLIELPQLDDYLTKEALKQDSLPELRKQSLLRLQSATAVDGGLEFRYTSLDYIGDDADRFRSWFRTDPLRYIWTGKRFERKNK